MTTFNTQTYIELVQRHAHECNFASHYGEPGYSDPGRGILFSNWNNVPKYISDALERRGFELEWSDEWLISYDTDKAYRSEPDCYSWKPYYVITEDGDVIGGDEIEAEGSSEQDDYVESLINNPRKCNVFSIDFEKHGFIQLEPTYESGWHPGQTDDPTKILADLLKQYPDNEYIFDLTCKGQFDISFKVWERMNRNA